MADPVWLDSSTLGNIVDGDEALEARIMGMGSPLLITPKVREEVLRGNPFQKPPKPPRDPNDTSRPAMRERPADRVQATNQALQRLNVQIDMAGSEADRRDLFEKQFKFKPNGRTQVRAMEESDAIILSQVKASANARGIKQPTFITSERRLANSADAQLWDVKIVRFEGGGPSSGPPRGGGGGGGGLTARAGDPWAGPGGTPGFDQTRIQGGAAALQELMAVAERLSMMSAAAEAWAEFKDRENDVQDLQNSNSMYPTWVMFDFTYAGGNGEQPKIYKYLPPMVLKSGGSPPTRLGQLREFSHTLCLPALKASGAASKDPALKFTGPQWMVGYTAMKDALLGDPNGWRAEDPARAHRVLNGSPMSDMLMMLKKLHSEEPKLFRLLENTVWNPYGINSSRNAAAIVAARMSDNSNGDTLGAYRASCKEYGLLPPDQQKDVDEFLNGKKDAEKTEKKAPTVPEWLPGWWTVWDGNYYYYYFTDQFTVSFVKTKPASANAAAPKWPNNKGKFILVEHGIKIFWNPVEGSSTQETFTQRDWKSQTEMNGVSNKYSPLFARKIA